MYIDSIEACKNSNLATAYVSTPEGSSIISDEVLDFQVRNGAGYDHFSVITRKLSIKHIWINMLCTQLMI